jgi:hypothetical protein
MQGPRCRRGNSHAKILTRKGRGGNDNLKVVQMKNAYILDSEILDMLDGHYDYHVAGHSGTLSQHKDDPNDCSGIGNRTRIG